GADAELRVRTLELPHRFHALVRIRREAPDESIGMPAERDVGIVSLADADHPDRDAPAVHLAERMLHGIPFEPTLLRDVAEHVFDRGLELLARLPVAGLAEHPLVLRAQVAVCKPDHRVDDPD